MNEEFFIYSKQERAGSTYLSCCREGHTSGYDDWREQESCLNQQSEALSETERVELKKAYEQADFEKIALFARKQMGAPSLSQTTVACQYQLLPTKTSCQPYLIRPKGGSEKPKSNVVIYLHGGGLIGGSTRASKDFLDYLAVQLDDTHALISLDYPLMPETSRKEIQKAVLAYIAECLQNGKKIQLAGDSSGGYLAAIVGQTFGKKIQSQLLIYPQLTFEETEFKPTVDFFEIPKKQQIRLSEDLLGMAQFMHLTSVLVQQQGETVAAPEVSLIRNREGIKASPPTLLLAAEYDGLALQGWLYYQALQANQVTAQYICYKGTEHAFIDQFGIIPQAKELAKSAVRWLKEGMRQ